MSRKLVKDAICNWLEKILILAYLVTVVFQPSFQSEVAAEVVDKKQERTKRWITNLAQANEEKWERITRNYPDYETSDLQKYLINGLIAEINEKKEYVSPAIIYALSAVQGYCNSCSHLGSCDNPECDLSRAEPTLFSILEHSQVPERRCAALMALSLDRRRNYGTAVDGIVRIISDASEKKIRNNFNICNLKQVIITVSLIGPDAKKAVEPLVTLFTISTDFDSEISMAIFQIGQSAIKKLAELLHYEEHIALRALGVLKEMGLGGTGQLAEAYSAVSGRVKEEILKALTQTRYQGEKRWGELLKVLYKSSKSNEQLISISGLISHSIATKQLADEISWALSSESESIRLYTVKKLEEHAEWKIEYKNSADASFGWKFSGDEDLVSIYNVILLPLKPSLDQLVAKDTSEQVRKGAKRVLSHYSTIEEMLSFRLRLKQRLQFFFPLLFGEMEPHRQPKIYF
jgi:hypothetical protein